MTEYFDYSSFEISPQIIEKKKIRRSANACGLGLLALFAIMYFWSFIYLRISIIFGIDVNDALNLAKEPFFSHLIGIFVSAIMVVIPFFIVAVTMGLKFSTEISFKKSKKGIFIPCFLLSVGFCLFSSFAVGLGSQIFTFFGIEFPGADTVFPKGVFGVIIAVISTAFFPAFLEELALRGFVLGLLRRNGDTFAIITSAVVFGFMHANFDQIVFAIMVGLILGYITVKTESIWCSIAVHFVNNLISITLSYLSDVSSLLSSLLLIILFVLTTLLGFVSLAVLQNKNPDFLKLEDNSQISSADKINWFLTSPMVIVSIIVSFLIAFFAR